MKSILKIYRTVLTPARNALVDDMLYYLENEAELYHEEPNFQYQRFALDMNITVLLSQAELSNQFVGNYVSILQDDKVWYYFVMSYEWKSPNALQLKLSIDSVNTFRDDFTLTDKTTIDRQHMNRWRTTDIENIYGRIIDDQIEEVEVLKYKAEDEKIQRTDDELDWFLIYRTRDELSPQNPNNPISCYCCANSAIPISRTGGEPSRTLYPSELPTGQYNYVLGTENHQFSFTLSWSGRGNLTLTEGDWVINYYYETPGDPTSTRYSRYGRIAGAKFSSQNGDIYFSLWIDNWTSTRPSDITLIDIGDIVASSTDYLTINTLDFARVSTDGNVPFPYVQTVVEDKVDYFIGEEVVRSLTPFSSIDKTNSKIVKLLRLPYAPCEIVYSNGVYNFPDEWIFEDGLMKLNDASLSTPLESDVKEIPLNTYLLASLAGNKRLTTAARSKENENKLLNSQFTELKFAYDSFSALCRLEAFKPTTENTFTLPIRFKQTNTINSKFLFDLQYPSFYRMNQDYENIIGVSRNNEETIFSSDYLNYIRSGYNYDKKMKQQEIGINSALTTVQLAATIASFAASSMPGLGPIGIAAGIGLAATTVSTLTNTIYQGIQGQQELNQKLYELSLQSASVAGTDDVDLMKYYSGNKLHKVVYKTREYQENAVANLLHFCGYKHKAMALPDMTSRYWFNFVQCDPVFMEESTTPYNRFLDDIRARFVAGLTVYHCHPLCNGGDKAYDWEQEYENWENDMAVQPRYTSMIELIADSPLTGTIFRNHGPAIDNETVWVEYQLTLAGHILNTRGRDPIPSNRNIEVDVGFDSVSRYRIGSDIEGVACEWIETENLPME